MGQAEQAIDHDHHAEQLRQQGRVGNHEDLHPQPDAGRGGKEIGPQASHHRPAVAAAGRLEEIGGERRRQHQGHGRMQPQGGGEGGERDGRQAEPESRPDTLDV